jgi:hypothetical protein
MAIDDIQSNSWTVVDYSLFLKIAIPTTFLVLIDARQDQQQQICWGDG